MKPGKHSRRKKLTAIQRLEGNPSKTLLQTSGFMALGEPFVPEYLTDDARGCLEIIKRSMPPQVYSAADTFLLAAFAMAQSVWRHVALKISDPNFEYVEEGEKMNRPSPWLTILNDQARIMATLSARLGLDPIARDAMHAVSNEHKNEFDGLLTGQVTYHEETAAK